jgi:hypothetical protein
MNVTLEHNSEGDGGVVVRERERDPVKKKSLGGAHGHGHGHEREDFRLVPVPILPPHSQPFKVSISHHALVTLYSLSHILTHSLVHSPCSLSFFLFYLFSCQWKFMDLCLKMKWLESWEDIS